mmetsp:Transcript_69227/g.203178  ORF Transcript_69227/g.203178 Transcript_69227/m.203178 type:complete len:210 (-) Transcript_69227:710-1339(-)
MRDPDENAILTCSGTTPSSYTSSATAARTACCTSARSAGLAARRSYSTFSTRTLKLTASLIAGRVASHASASWESSASLARWSSSSPCGGSRLCARSFRSCTLWSKAEILKSWTKAGSGGFSSTTSTTSTTAFLPFLPFFLSSLALSFLPSLAFFFGSGGAMTARCLAVYSASHCLYCLSVPWNLIRTSSGTSGYSASWRYSRTLGPEG